MEYLLVMSLSGSTMTGIYLLLRYLFKGKISARLYYLLAKVAVIYYLIPLPFLKGWYREALSLLLPGKQMSVVQIPLTWTNYAVHADDKTYVNVYAVIQTVLAVVWILAVCILMGRMLIDYVRTSRLIVGYAGNGMTDQEQSFLAGIKEQYGVKQRVILCSGYAEAHTMTFGVFRPVIICDRKVDNPDAKLLVSHEMVHIKRRDVLWKILVQFAAILHWWNPIIQVLQYDFERVCELSCDETSVQGQTTEGVSEHRTRLVREVLSQGKAEKAVLRWKASFGNRQNEIKERMDNLMTRKRWNRLTAGILVTVLAFANSITVFAYRDVVHKEMPEASQEAIDETLGNDTIVFAPDVLDETGDAVVQDFELLEKIEIQYDRQFTDEEGNVYPIAEEEPAVTYRGCSHTFVSGTLTEHGKKSDGGCVVKEYRAQRCSKCGYMIQGDLISTHEYVVCPH